MNRLIRVLRDRRGESMVEILVSTVVFMLLLGALPTAFVGYFSAIMQAKTAVAGIGLLAKRPEEAGKAITMAIMVETYAVFALLISMLVILLLPIG